MALEIVGRGKAESAGDCAGVLLAMVDKWADARPMTHPLQSRTGLTPSPCLPTAFFKPAGRDP